MAMRVNGCVELASATLLLRYSRMLKAPAPSCAPKKAAPVGVTKHELVVTAPEELVAA